MNSFSTYIRKIFGIDVLEQELKSKIEALEQANATTAGKVDPDSISPKEEATLKKEPYITVNKTHVNPDNIRTGFFELDWNEYFVLQLKENGYPGSSDEEIVDGWFQELCRNIGEETGVDMNSRGKGYVNVSNIGNSRSEIG